MKTNARSFLHLLVLTMVGLLTPNRSFAQLSSSPREDFWITDGSVKAILVTNGIAYIGGTFGNVGLPRSFGTVLDRQTGQADLEFPKISGTPRGISIGGGVITAAASDGNGGWFIGGIITAVGGTPRHGLAHILSDNTLDPNWNPDPSYGGLAVRGPIAALLVWQNRVYVSGTFSLIGGFPRNGLAALDLTTGEAINWDPNSSPSALVLTMAASGDKLYVGGIFSSMAGQNRNNIAAFDLPTGNLSSWNPGASGGVSAIAAAGTNVYVAGTFTSIGGRFRTNLAALSISTGVATAWNPATAGGTVDALAVSGDIVNGLTVYAAGTFTNIGGLPRRFLAALDANSGMASPWNPDISPAPLIRTLQVSGNTVYLGGKFQAVNGAARINLAALDASTGQVLPWNPNPIDGSYYPKNGDVYSVVINGNKVFVGGNFLGMNAVPRSNLAALDANTGVLTSWSPSVAGSVSALASAGSTVYLAGDFTSVGGESRSRVAAVDAVTGTLLSWAPPIQGTSVASLATSSNTVILGGTFTNVGGLSRRNLAAVDASSGIPTTLNPDPDGVVSALLVSSNLVYVGGAFTHIGGQTRLKGVAAVELASGNVTGFNPDPTSITPTLALAIDENMIFAGGYYSYPMTGPAPRLSAFDAPGSTTLWGPKEWPGKQVNALAKLHDTLFVGGSFGNSPQNGTNLAALSLSTGQAIDWAPFVGGLDAAVLALATDDKSLFAGGSFGGGLSVFSPRGFVHLAGERLENGSFRLRVGAAANETYMIQSSSNLVQWLNVATNTGAGFFTYPAGTPGSRRFYRTVGSP